MNKIRLIVIDIAKFVFRCAPGWLMAPSLGTEKYHARNFWLQFEPGTLITMEA